MSHRATYVVFHTTLLVLFRRTLYGLLHRYGGVFVFAPTES